ncbi:glycosyltransferase family 25 protein [Pseudoalteromonas shioyasakiensis]|uniref:glycosyltransferase family 25 protein n=1 Tax=Pseudoalteromonas shioyasakiensis TaxID=1190813 RepID=UPI0021193505|nr:glycosyltransferase family 25 protein [Pseudoalteromonas shioyasakiensis]MCQ8878380.1 glycosyltransferase family 25 protein [Pseudoalteromonas shioyasakiensis]
MPTIFVINLERSPERLATSQQQLASHGLCFERIDAVDGATLTPAQINSHYSARLNKEKYHYPLSVGQIGCYLSHRKAWQTIVDRQLDYAIVLEDDFILEESLTDTISNIEQLQPDWQMIKLSAYQNRTRPIAYQAPLRHQQYLVIHKKLMTGCCATAISYDGAKQLLAATEKFGRPVDCDLQHIWETQVAGYSLMPYPFAQNCEQVSDIKARSAADIKKSFFARKAQQFTSAINNHFATAAFIKNAKRTFHTPKSKKGATAPFYS